MKIKLTDIETRTIPCIGTCEICGEKMVYLKRTYFKFDGIKCECHSPCHFELVNHCHQCVPKPPNRIKIEFLVDSSNLKRIQKLKRILNIC